MTCAVGFFVADASAQESLPKRVRELLDGTLSTNLTVVITVTHLCVLTYQKTHQEGLELVGSVQELEEIHPCFSYFVQIPQHRHPAGPADSIY